MKNLLLCYIIAGDRDFKLAFASTSGASLWSLEAIKEMCTMDKNLVLSTKYASTNGCPSHSIGYYIGWMRNNTECDQLTEEDITATLQVCIAVNLS